MRQGDAKHTDYVVVVPLPLGLVHQGVCASSDPRLLHLATKFHESFEEHLKAIVRQAYGAQ